MKDINIIGSGPAGLTAAIYSIRFGYDVNLFTGPQRGGQLTITSDVENYPGFSEPVAGPELMEKIFDQAKRLNVNIIEETIESVDFSANPFSLISSTSNVYCSKSVIVATGAKAKWLNVNGEAEFMGRGVSACAICDAFFFKNKDIVVIGGGNTAVEEVLYLSKFAKSVTLIHRRDSLRAEKIMQKKLFTNEKVKVVWNTSVVEICGTNKVTHLVLKDVMTNGQYDFQTDGVFVAIGHEPSTAIFKNALAMSEDGYIITSPGTTFTSKEGIFAAGDVQDRVYRQAVTAAGFGCMAAMDADKFLKMM